MKIVFHRFLFTTAAFSLLMLFTACSDQAPSATAQESEAASTSEMAIPPRANEARPSPNASVLQTIGTTVVTITYGRPAVKGREVFGGLEPYGEVWRAGANEATVFATSGDVQINGEALPAGVYSFFAIPTEDGEWTIIFNNQAEQWGAFRYDESQDALRVTTTAEEGASAEWLSYSFENLSDGEATAVLHWSTTRVPFTISVQ